MGVMDVVDFLYDGTPKSEFDGLVFASPLFDIPGGTVGAPNFGVISATKIDNRQMQLALRYAF